MDPIQTIFLESLKPYQIELSEQQLLQYELYYKELVSWNEKMNLTGITEREQVYVKHFFDSLSVSFFVSLKDKKSLADIGSGAGFPSIPLKIAFPHLKITIVDSLNKRIQFLNHLSSTLGLTNVECIHGRAEDIARLPQHRDSYDIVTARAVAKLSVLNEFCLPFTAIDGCFIAMKGNDVQEEVKEASYSLKELKGKHIHTHHFELPDEEHSTRHLVVIRKTFQTPYKYPRKAGLPLKLPLI
ncbi:16S rRNA (guanine(527)-N(7))-methyltransferase RsmG [Paenibacillus radicis (ex Xue et al. 2023)]|uniref:Ribosomal RNA small subunit methyltransferase G n=1 Tax=Paenibacillus radicis (ex Xue et al. 2023) TaxID=2972489 RepID=A0ABT1YUZ0_9BACL|nr:16S rRNA (guanine(527)-N(7))-methyltransferase RsmG [Paenibacillus radicis (ex Xue et al. 2023)]MCR8636771.1 16S rRNA (guanine(527)-N(7))-methyltransferase RsmG [Paenibacillus radicis (ex Xue et al. 2023)]